MLAQCSDAVVSALYELPRNSSVRVVVRGATRSAPSASSSTIDPKQFGSVAEYRAALIQQQKHNTQGIKEGVAEKARSLGLSASPASALNAVTVEGRPDQVLELLDQVDVETAVVERPLNLSPLPKPR